MSSASSRTHELSPPLPSRAALLALVFAAFVVVAALEASHAAIGQHFGYVRRASLTTVRNGEALIWLDIFLRQLSSWWIFGLLAWGAVAFTRRRPVEPGQWHSVVPHVFMSLLFAFVVILVTTAFRYRVFMMPDTTTPFRNVLFNRLSLYYATELLYYWAIVGTYSAFRYYSMYRERALSEARLARALSEARLTTLQARLQPHFLFNTMNAICGHAAEQNHRVVIGMITRLSDLLRAAFRNQDRRTIPLAQELQLLRSYIELQEFRLGDRLAMTLDIDDDVMTAEVPPLILQPLVERAVTAASRTGPGAVTIDIGGGPEFISIAVYHDATCAGDSQHDGPNMAEIHSRLHLLYGGTAQLNEYVEESGVGLCLRLPLEPMNNSIDGAHA